MTLHFLRNSQMVVKSITCLETVPSCFERLVRRRVWEPRWLETVSSRHPARSRRARVSIGSRFETGEAYRWLSALLWKGRSGKTYCKGRLSTVDLLVLISLDQLVFILK